MPELPEVEAARKAIEEHCVGKKVKRAMVADDPKVIVGGVSPSAFEAALVGKTILSARRKGKNLWLELDSPPFPSFQFGMAGAVHIKGVAVTKYRRAVVNDTDEWPSKYSKAFVELDDGLEFSFTDKRRFARVRLLEDPKSAPPISELGPDALLEPMHVLEFVESLGKKKLAIKTLLLDQSFIAGIGNWIADEVLYQAKIHPLQIASSLSRDECESLHRCIKEVVQFAVEVNADSSRFPIGWLFHFRWGKKSGKVDGKKIEFISAGGRTSAFVPELQKLTGSRLPKSSSCTEMRKSNKDQEKEEEEERSEVLPKKKDLKKRAAAERRKPSKSQKDEELQKNSENKKRKTVSSDSTGGQSKNKARNRKR
ncbi:formamidopyrimidine-DNA glycosylase isoform X2 [Aristolochia californica]|uniref:formamidopyrimidine-DNA glycosylase isoform X2 n=1 Tax=Aristolochia californica TaxID=171875 RepID=UPI0035DE9F0E